MSEIDLDYDSPTEQLLDYMSIDCEWAADEVRSRFLALQERISALEKVAEWGEAFDNIATQATNALFNRWEDYVHIQTEHRKALRAAGYLKEQGC